MSDQQLISQLIAGNPQVIEDFFFVRCRAMLTYIGQYFCQNIQSPEELQRYRNQQKAERELAEKRRKYGVGSVSEGYSIGYNDALGNVNNIMSYKYSTTPYYTEQFLDGYRRGFSRGQDELMKNTLRNMRSW